MADDPGQPAGRLSRRALILMMLLAGGGTLALLCGSRVSWVLAMIVAVPDGALAAVIVLAAGGYGYLLIRPLAPAEAPVGLKVVTACVLGLWLLSTAMLAVGSLCGGLLTPWAWWPVLGVGAALAMWQGRRAYNQWQPHSRFDGRALIWVVLAVAAGFWLAGATMPPGTIGLQERYDILEYHLQVPREFHDAQRIGPLWHNCYSFYPLGVEMLFLLAMSLHGGAYEGVYLAQMLHGVFGVLAVAGVYLGLRRQDDVRARFAVGILATVPLVLCLSWLAMSELAQICCLALAVLWLRHWLQQRTIRAAACIGLMLGAGCATKYLAVGFLAGPVLLMMMAACLRRPRPLGGVLVASMLTVLLMSPWLVRNLLYTGNPVFPLATGIFGRGHWSAPQQQRWTSGHQPGAGAPVPSPPGYRPADPQPSRVVSFYRHFMVNQLFGPVLLIVAGLGICLLLAQPSRADAWDWSLTGILAAQLAVWTAATRDMPPRFIVPAVLPLALLASGALAALSRAKTNPLRPNAPPPAHGPWGLAPAVAVFALLILAVNFLTAYGAYQATAQDTEAHGLDAGGLTIAAQLAHAKDPNTPRLPRDARLLLIGQATAFYFPPRTLYATAFDTNPLEEMLRDGMAAPQVLARLKELGVTHIWGNWAEIWRLAWTYGYSPELTAGMFRQWRAGAARPGLDELEEMIELGAVAQDLPDARFRTAGQGGQELLWPAVTLYSLPWAAPAASAPAAGQ